MRLLAKLFGRDREDALSVPAMDGVFKPNTMLDTALSILDLQGIDDLAAGPQGLYCSSGNQIFAVDPDAGLAHSVAAFDGTVTALAASPTGGLAVGVEGTGIKVKDGGTWRRIPLPADCVPCITAVAFAGNDELYMTIGSRKHPAYEWKRDLMSHGASGAVLRCRLSTGTTDVVADGLAFPNGLAIARDGGLAVSESWRHRIIAVGGRNASATVLVPDLPAYPARLATAHDSGVWLALFAARRQLTEFVLGEDDYRRDMMATIPPDAWIGPDFAAASDERQPVQAGSVRQMGIMKPWAPSRSYGLVAKLDRAMTPVASLHSRADGRRHGITAVAENDGFLYVASRGSGALLRLKLDDEASA